MLNSRKWTNTVWAMGLALAVAVGAPKATWAETQVQVPNSQLQIQLSFSPVVKKAAPAVVNIFAKRVAARSDSPFANDPFFSRMMGDAVRPPPRVQNSLGSGVILHESGILVSNFHVVGNATSIRVVLADRRVFDGKIILADQSTDIAIIQLQDAENLPVLEYADSDAVEVGDLVLAIGNPFGLGQTVSSGIVSGLARSGVGGAMGQSKAAYFVQTDAPINPGNSGGALVDMQGRLIGVNTSILTRSGGSNGIGFAIPANIVKRYIDQALAGASQYESAWSGLRAVPVDVALSRSLGMPLPQGVRITQLHRESPFAKAGLAAGDIVLEIDGVDVFSPGDLDYRLSLVDLGDEVTVRAISGGKLLDLTFKAAPIPEGRAPDVRRVTARTPFAGLQIANLSPRLAERYNMPMEAMGVIITDVQGTAKRTGLLAGDRIRTVNGAKVEDAATMEEVLSQELNAWNVEIDRGGRKLRLRLKL